MIPDRVIVLNLARRADRLLAFRRGLPADWPYPEPEIVDAIDGCELDIPAAWADAGAGAYGCAQTHLRALRAALADDVETLLVLEDDAVFATGFTATASALTANLPPDARMVMLGGQHFAYPQPVAPGIVRCADTQRTHAYMLRRTAIPVVLRVWSATTDHIDRSAATLQALVPVYAPSPFLIGQAAGCSDITTRNEPERYWSGILTSSLRSRARGAHYRKDW